MIRRLSFIISLSTSVVFAGPSHTGPELHAINSGMNNRDITISPDGSRLYTSITSPKNDHAAILESQFKFGRWSELKLASFSGQYPDIEPMYSPNGMQLFFASKRPKPDREGDDWDIWYMNQTPEGWSTPINAGNNINSTGDEFYPSIAANGNLYFTATRKVGVGSEDIFISRRLSGSRNAFSVSEALKGAVNTKTYEFNAFIAPDESYIIYGSQRREGEIGGGDIYISFRGIGGEFAKGKLLPTPVNTDKLDYCPYVWRNRFFFTSERRVDLGDVNSAKILENKFNAPGNGLGDIYSIALEKIFEGALQNK